MTTILAIISAVIFFTQSSYLILVLVVLLGLAQSLSKRIMNNHVKHWVAEGLSAIEAAETIPNGLAGINMVLSFSIYGLFAFAIYSRFF